jgi:hypothetical protein
MRIMLGIGLELSVTSWNEKILGILLGSSLYTLAIAVEGDSWIVGSFFLFFPLGNLAFGASSQPCENFFIRDNLAGNHLMQRSLEIVEVVKHSRVLADCACSYEVIQAVYSMCFFASVLRAPFCVLVLNMSQAVDSLCEASAVGVELPYGVEVIRCSFQCFFASSFLQRAGLLCSVELDLCCFHTGCVSLSRSRGECCAW